MPAEANGGPECIETNGESVPVDENSGSKEQRLCRYQWRAGARAGMYRCKQGVGKAGVEVRLVPFMAHFTSYFFFF